LINFQRLAAPQPPPPVHHQPHQYPEGRGSYAFQSSSGAGAGAGAGAGGGGNTARPRSSSIESDRRRGTASQPAYAASTSSRRSHSAGSRTGHWASELPLVAPSAADLHAQLAMLDAAAHKRAVALATLKARAARGGKTRGQAAGAGAGSGGGRGKSSISAFVPADAATVAVSRLEQGT
jgi:hypothetical protein